ncbi:MAG: hypothetical protein IT319_17505 [Anaerolineae bacterium]|nr:hypothetical protein [Anaerolineae bacterium]
MTADPELTPKPKRKRKTKAEREAERQAEAAANAAKPIDPVIWIIVGAGILFFALWTWLDPITFATAGQNPSIFQLIPVVMIRIFGETPAILILTVLGVIPLAFGIIGWLRKRFGKAG